MSEFVPLSSRYGISTQSTMWDLDARRHLFPTVMDDVPSDEHRCVCPGGKGVARPCILTSTGNYLCDACREHCWGVDPSGKRWRFADAYGPTYTHVAPIQGPPPPPPVPPAGAVIAVASPAKTLTWASNGKRVHCYEADSARSLCRASWSNTHVTSADLPRCKNCERLASAREAA